jgi:hypothetical protein
VLFGPAFPRNAVLRVFGEFGQFVGLADLDENCVDALDTTFVRNFREQPEHALVFPSPRGQVLNDDNFRHRPSSFATSRASPSGVTSAIWPSALPLASTSLKSAKSS